ncbi:MAG: DUF898 family protein [Bacteroidota bacterium]
MENTEFKKLLKFNGDHGQLVGLRIMNNILTALTIGIYYPWARASYLKYIYGESEYTGTRFVFHGTGKEMFVGFIKAVGIILGLYILLLLCVFSKIIPLMIIGMILFYVAILFLIPIAIHGSNKYRLSRTSWRGIHFGYRGILKEFIGLFLLEGFLTLITLGIYGSWMQVKVSKYIMSHTRFGNIEFRFDGEGSELFLIKLKGFFLTILTLGIYAFWYYKQLIEFEIGHLKIIQNGKEIKLRSSITPGQIFGLLITNYLIIIFTLGIGTGIAINRIMRTALENIEFDNEIDTTNLVQTESEYKDATGDDLAGMLDISMI